VSIFKLKKKYKEDKLVKLTVVFTGCGQVGIDTYADYHKTIVIEFTEEQKEQMKPPKGMRISGVIFEED
jgi:diphthamide synthase subunit DPH2